MKGKEYVRPIPATTWWLKKQPYTRFMIREFTALFVGGYAIFLIVLVYRASQGQDAFTAFVEGLKSPASIVLHLLTLAMTAYHSATWFGSMAKVLVLWRGEERVNPGTIIASGYLLWAVVSVVVVGIALAARG
jgi:fumarate reductase subunit C